MPSKKHLIPYVDRSVSVAPDADVSNAPAGYEDLEGDASTIGATSGEYFGTAKEAEQARLRLHDAQVVLAELGHLGPEAVDDAWGLRTKDALCAFQDENDLEVTGQLDAQTYEALLAIHETNLEQLRDVEPKDDWSPFHAEEPLKEG